MRMTSSFLLVFAFAGCGTPANHLDGSSTKYDLAGMVVDLAGPPDDLAQPPVGADTGAACVKSSDCGGNKPLCVTKGAQGIDWPGGYCTSQCNPQKNDPNDSTNPACPGGNGTCRGNGTVGSCETACTAMAGANKCTRAGYSCFQSCEPTTISQCDPTKKGSCPQDGGAPITTVTSDKPDSGIPDGGNPDAFTKVTMSNAPRVCTLIGADPVGACSDGCDPLAAQSAVMPAQPCRTGDGCYPTYATGEGFCFTVYGGGGGDGTACQYLNGCDPGFACRTINKMGVCKQICGGPKSVACPMGQTCKDLSTMVKASVIGSCE